MTKNEAIKQLKEMLTDYKDSYLGEFSEARKDVDALHMAIEALQTDIVRCGSCIHGQKILKAKEEVACDIWGGIWTENGFCSCGERRANE